MSVDNQSKEPLPSAPSVDGAGETLHGAGPSAQHLGATHPLKTSLCSLLDRLESEFLPCVFSGQVSPTNECYAKIQSYLEAEIEQTIGDFDFFSPSKTDLIEGYRRILLMSGQNCGAYMMLWPPGTKSPIHDHAQTWCIERVCLGRLEIREFAFQRKDCRESGLIEKGSVELGTGAYAFLNPPNDVHQVSNPSADEWAVSLNVYGKLYTECSIFKGTSCGGAVRGVSWESCLPEVVSCSQLNEPS